MEYFKGKLENHSVNTDKDGNECWNKFKDKFLLSQDECVLKKNKKNGKLDASFCCQDIKTKLLKRNKLYKKWKFFPSETNLLDLTKTAKEIKKLIRQARRNGGSRS